MQGINDLVTPFFLVFLQDFSPKDVNEIVVEEEVAKVDRDAIEADSFWCLSKGTPKAIQNGSHATTESYILFPFV